MKTAFVLINTELCHEIEVADTTRKIDGVVKVNHIVGGYDLLVQVQGERLQNVRDIITWKVRKNKYIRSTLTLIVTESGFEA